MLPIRRWLCARLPERWTYFMYTHAEAAKRRAQNGLPRWECGQQGEEFLALCWSTRKTFVIRLYGIIFLLLFYSPSLSLFFSFFSIPTYIHVRDFPRVKKKTTTYPKASQVNLCTLSIPIRPQHLDFSLSILSISHPPSLFVYWTTRLLFHRTIFITIFFSWLL